MKSISRKNFASDNNIFFIAKIILILIFTLYRKVYPEL